MTRDVLYIENAICLESTKVKQYGYRSARIVHTLLEIPRNDILEKFLSEKANKEKDNHTLYQVTLDDGTTFAILCHDFTMYIGLGIKEERW